jgi:hypothetical protein
MSNSLDTTNAGAAVVPTVDVVTLQFTVPSELRHTFDMELELLRHQMDPVVSWLERNGGGVSRSDTL